MTRINTNVSSLVAQRTLGRSNVDLQQALTRLSTGLRINTGADDPSGLIASEALRSDIGAIKSAIGNSERANQVIGTADSALAQVSDILNDIRGLVTEAANKGGLSPDQIAANQLQVDESLEALNQISQTTSFQGLRLLDGSLDFNTTPGSNFSTAKDLSIDKANLGSTGQVNVNVTISAAATQAQLTNTGGFTAATNAAATLTLAPELFFDNTNFASNAQLFFQATSPGTDLEGVTVQFVGATGIGAGNETAVYDSSANTLTITVDDTDATTAQDIADAVNTQVADFHVDVSTFGGEAVTAAEALALNGTTVADFLTINAASAGPDFNNVDVQILADAGVPAGTPTASYDANTKQLTIRVNNTANTTLANIATAIDGTAEFAGTVVSATAADESLNIAGGNVADFSATASTGNSGGGTLANDVVFELSGKDGAQVFNLKTGTTITDVANAINLVTDATGVTATSAGTTLTFNSSAYGTAAKVEVDVIQDSGGAFTAGLSSTLATGNDIAAKVNGFDAKGTGNKLTINSATLDLSLTVDDGSSLDVGFTITGGGALFQLGPDVVSNQQARIGIQSVNTARLGGASGLLFQLGSGESASLENDSTTAARIVTEAINQVTSLRGRLGAFQKTSLDTNIASLNDTLINLIDAESAIRDADFAAETANLTRAQILVQSGTTVLSIANSNPQNVLALLR